MARHTKAPRLDTDERGVYVIRYNDGRTRRISTGTRDRSEAEVTFAQWLQDRHTKTPRLDADPTLGEALIRYYNGHIAPRATDKDRRRSAQRWLADKMARVRVSEVDDALIAGYVEDRRTGKIGKRPAADSTIRYELGVLQAALAYLVRQRLLSKDAVPHIERPREGAPRDDYMTADQVDTLLAWFAERDQDGRMSRAHRFVVLGLATGARKRAIELLTWDQVDRQAGLIRFDRQVRVQTRKRRVAAPIPDWAVPYLDRMASERESAHVLDHDGNIRGAFEWALAMAAKDTGVPAFATLTRHALRHTVATLALQAGASIFQVAGLLGDTPETIARTYGHHSQEHTRAAANIWKKS